MGKSNQSQHSKVFYRPIEVAIRWSGLMRFESRILRTLGDKSIPGPNDFPRWPMLRLNMERLYDAFRNGELPYGKSGITCDDPALLTDPDLTVRHVDLKTWMAHYYPDQKPEFLFDGIERHLHPAISFDSMQALLVDREALKLQLAELEKSFNTLNEQHRLLCQQTESKTGNDHPISLRGESTYLSIVGGLLTLLLGQSPSGKRYSSFETTDSIISALLAHYPGQPGISERTLWAKFTAAKRHVNADPN
ncbi:MAG: hypothetical protein H7A04_20460 [Pseudomonadales bacterium]|nr:hypothetical protein [Pseudomonadales bacterium]